ncbi:MAG: BstXI family restriction endonuclease [Bryobacterales bacterium]|nr:BstXI family restriction endonuclease [Bryobacterales bacterium]
MTVDLCGYNGCRKQRRHKGPHDPRPSQAWAFLTRIDKGKIEKAGFATPRGGQKGAYQNHVQRSNTVIVPYEHLETAPLHDFGNGYVVRLFPEQYFKNPGQVKKAFKKRGAPVVGENAFILYRTHSQFDELPPLDDWKLRWLEMDGERVSRRRPGAVDHGEYVMRIAARGNKPPRIEGPPQGIFAPEYANAEDNYMAKCVLAWLTVHTVDGPYVAAQAAWLEAILEADGLLDMAEWARLGLIRAGHTACPLCMGLIRYEELHSQVGFEDEKSLQNAGEQVLDATRSTVVNLFHLDPLVYSRIEHGPRNVAWGHATCNTKLGQRKCYSLYEVIEDGSKVGTVDDNGNVQTFGWSSDNLEMIRSPRGAVWIRVSEDHLTEEEQGDLFDLLNNSP